MKFCCVLSTVSSLKEARQLAGLLVSKKLAACVQILPGIESHYRWKGKKAASKEVLLIIKARSLLYRPLEQTILKNHSYEVPEIVCLPIVRGSKSYLNWIAQEAVAS